MEPARLLAERGDISHRDASILFMMCSYKEIYTAVENATIWELRDRVLINLRDHLNKRYPHAQETRSQEHEEEAIRGRAEAGCACQAG